MRICPECKRSVNDWAEHCPNCGLQLHPAVLQWRSFEARPGQKGNFWLINFTDMRGNQHSWAPRWDDLLCALISACILEKHNARSDEWLEELTEAATVVLETCAERVVPLFGSIEGARELLRGCQEKFAKELLEAFDEYGVR